MFLLIHVADDRHQQPVLRIDGDADVNVLLEHDLFAGDVDRGVELREHLQRRGNHLDGNRRDRQLPAGGFDPLRVLLPQPLEFRDVGLVALRDVRHRSPGGGHPLGRLAADGAHRLALDLTPLREVRQRDGPHGRARSGAADDVARVRLHVLHRNAPARARPGTCDTSRPELARVTAGRGRRRHRAGCRGLLGAAGRDVDHASGPLPLRAGRFLRFAVPRVFRLRCRGRTSTLINFPESLLTLLAPALVCAVDRARLAPVPRSPAHPRSWPRRRSAPPPCALATLGPAAFGSGGRHVGGASRRRSRITAPTFTLSPGLTRSSLMTPLTDEGTSMVALSVSSSRTG